MKNRIVGADPLVTALAVGMSPAAVAAAVLLGAAKLLEEPEDAPGAFTRLELAAELREEAEKLLVHSSRSDS
jgi:hypothetical protein